MRTVVAQGRPEERRAFSEPKEMLRICRAAIHLTSFEGRWEIVVLGEEAGELEIDNG